MEPVTMALVVAYFLLRRGGENVMWAFRKDGADPPSFRRWQERQKRRGARGSITGRAEARKFWAHVWHDAHASAHEWRQRRRGRAWEERRKRWQAEDVQRQQNQPLAPCVFCGAGRGTECAPNCPEVLAHRANRGSDNRATVPPQPNQTVPPVGSGPSQPSQPTPTSPSHPGGTVPNPTQPTKPAPSQATVPPLTTQPIQQPQPVSPQPTPAPSQPNPAITPTVNPAAATNGKEQTQPGKGAPSSTGPQIAAPIPIHRNRTGATPNNNAPDNSNGGTVTTPATYNHGTPATPSGEFAGYEATVAGWDQISQLGAQLDAAYERQMAHLRQLKADEQTIGQVARAREANENHMVAAGEARNDWVTRQGAVKDVKDATGARGDEALHR